MVLSRHASSRCIISLGHVAKSFPQEVSKIWRRSVSSVVDKVKEGDIVLLKAGASFRDFQLFTKPLKHGDRIGTHFGDFTASQIIGKPYRDVVRSCGKRKGRDLRIHAPSLDEYVKLTPRKVTPIYAQDCNLITSLLDIHVQPPVFPASAPANRPDIEVLEAGTGHGSLTLHLARAIQAANPPLPEVLSGCEPQDEDAASYYKTELHDWKRRRRAVIHTVEKEKQNSAHARRIVAGFRRGIYAPHVDFHVGDVADFIEEQMRARLADSNNTSDSHLLANADPDEATQGEPSPKPHQIYTHIILDLPSTHTYMRLAARALKDGGTLIIFCPSITQIAQCVQVVREYKLPLNYSTVLELGQNMVGGKSWDVRAAKIRKKAEERVMKGAAEARKAGAPADVTQERGILTRLRHRLGNWLLNTGAPPTANKQGPKAQRSSPSSLEEEEQERWEMVARPSVGARVVGGGFVGIWHRKRNWELYEEEDARELDNAAGKERDGNEKEGDVNEKDAADAAQASAQPHDPLTDVVRSVGSEPRVNSGGGKREREREVSSQRRNRESVQRALEG